MRTVLLVTIILFLLTTIGVIFVFADNKGNISAIYGYSPLDSLKGLSAAYGEDFGNYNIEVDGSVKQGTIVEGDAHAAIAFDVPFLPVQLKPFGEVNVVKTEDWGHTLDGGLKINVPINEFDVAIGVFGRSSNAFVPLQQGTRNPVTGEVKWDDATLLDFDDLGVLNALFEAQFTLNRFKIGMTGIFDISNKQFHQVITEAQAAWQVAEGLQFTLTGKHIAQVGENEEDGGQQISLMAGLGYKF